jgi:hypothetical protein
MSGSAAFGIERSADSDRTLDALALLKDGGIGLFPLGFAGQRGQRHETV